MNGVTFVGKHSYNDFQLIMTAKRIGTPSKKKIKVDVPGMNSVYDFSTIASNGELIYNQRAVEVDFTLFANSKRELHSALSKVDEWLQDTVQGPLIFDDISYYYFLAEVEDSLKISEEHNTADITVKFIAEPFKTGINLVGNTLWDTFNFLEDVLQDSSYDVVGTKTVSIYNPGRLVTPVINCSTAMSVVFAGKTYTLIAGDNTPYGMKILSGANSLVINGTGTLSVLFRKVIL